jgi:hypothetical protein
MLDAGIMPGAISIRLDKWLDHWLETIKKPKVDPTTFRYYELAVRVYLKPTIGHIRLDRLTTADVRLMHTTQKKSSRNAQKAHQALAAALKDAMAELELAAQRRTSGGDAQTHPETGSGVHRQAGPAHHGHRRMRHVTKRGLPGGRPAS